ncbi:transposase (plasmid) [Rhizobium sullae]|uniref:Transposase n=2 Tax=Rhizobium sullae TaxID=50338 RepID=A0ABY5XPR2_RHISU|nr:transposase [Rhizobium sullae]UWU16610.1 transposase [Rhizobium sullae]
MPSRHRLSSFDQIKELPGLKAHLPFLKDVPNHCLQQAAVDLDKAFKNFFKGHAAYPKARRKFQNESFRFPDPKQISFGEKGILLPKAGWVKLVLHRPFLGVVNALALSDGTVYDLPRMTEKEKRREANLARRVSRRSRGSKNRLRAQRDLRRFRARIVRRRRDAKHKMTTDVVSRCDVLYLEDLKLKNMTASAKGTVEEPGTNVAQKSGLNRAILDVSPGATRLQFEYKMRRRGGAVFYVNPARTSQRCAECGHVDPKNRIDRDRFECVRCGHAACADHNAGPGMACGSNLAGGRKQEEDGSSQVAQAA